MRALSPLLVLLVACTPQSAVRGGEAIELIRSAATLYVDERALEGGDGSAAKPFRTVQQALAQPRDGELIVEIHSGLYKGPFALSAGLTLRGRGGAVVLHSDGDMTVNATGGALERLIVQGGQIGIQVSGPVRLDKLELSGQRRVAIEVVSGALTATELKLEASVSETVGLSLRAPGKAQVSSSRWHGPYRRGVEQHGGELTLTGARFDESVIAVHCRAGTATMTDVRVRGGREAAFLINAAKVALRRANVQGQEYGLLASQGADLDLSEFEVSGSERAGLAMTAAKASIDGLRVHEGGSYAAVQLTQSMVIVKNAQISKATAAGFLINGGTVMISHTSVSGSRNTDGSSGDGIIARTGTVELTSVQIGQAEGAGVLSGNAAELTLNRVIVDGARHGGFVADYKGKLRATQVIAKNVREGAFVAIEGATMSVDDAQVESAPDGLAWVDCASGSTLKLRRLKSAVAAPPSACIDAGP